MSKITGKILLWGGSFLALAVIVFVLIAIERAGKIEYPPLNNTTVSEYDHALGPVDAGITLVEYSDFQCPGCKSFSVVLNTIVEEYEGKVRLVYRHFPLSSIHPMATFAAEVAEAAGKQGKFFEMHDLLFERQSEWSKSNNPKAVFMDYVKELGLDIDKYEKDLVSAEVASKVEHDRQTAEELGLGGTPTLYLNGNNVDITGGYTELKKMIDAELTRLEEVADATINAGIDDGENVGAYVEE
jgi:protein-disulfide isomerase